MINTLSLYIIFMLLNLFFMWVNFDIYFGDPINTPTFNYFVGLINGLTFLGMFVYLVRNWRYF